MCKRLLSDLCLLYINGPRFDPVLLLLKQVTGNQHLEFESLDEKSFGIILDFCSILVEELIKKEQTQLHELIYQQIFPTVDSVFSHLNSCQINTIPYQVHTLSLSCLNSWISYISMAEAQSKVRYSNPHQLLRYLFNFLENFSTDTESIDLVNKSISSITEILEMNPQMLDSNSRSYLKLMIFEPGKFGQNFIHQVVFSDLREEFEDEISNFVNLIIVFLQNDILSITRHLMDPENRYIIDSIVKLTNFPGFPKIDEDISDQLLGFWEEFFNIFIDDEDTLVTYYENQGDYLKEQFFKTRDDICNRVCMIYWEKIRSPPGEKLQLNRSEFFFFKANVGDFFSTIYSLLKLPFYESMVDLAIEKITGQNMIDLEATLFLLYKINDDSTFYESQSNLLLPSTHKLIDQGRLFDMLPNLADNILTYYYIISTIINYIASIQFYLKTEQGPAFLGNILDFLFTIIIHSNNPKLSLTSSKTVLNICQECRTNLIVFLPTLKQLLNEMIQNPQIDNLIRTRMTNSFVSIGLSAHLRNPSEFSILILDIFKLIKLKSDELMLQGSMDENTQDYLISLLSCLPEIGKASVLPDDLENVYTPQEASEISTFWEKDQFEVKSTLLNILKIFSIDFLPFRNKSNVTEICCQTLKSGMNEPIDNPFKIDLNVIFSYLVQKCQCSDGNSVYHIFKLIETIVITNHKSLSPQIIDELVINMFIPCIQETTNDPELASSLLDIFTSILDKTPSLIIYNGKFDLIVKFSIDTFQYNEIIAIKSLLKFWSSLLNLKRGTQQDQTLIKSLLAETDSGQMFVQALLNSFFNNSRSSLENYFLMFRSLLSKFQLFAKSWLSVSLSNLNLHANDSEKNTFVEKLLLTRGQRLANDVLKKFWIQANGLVEFNTQSY